ncbi:MAG TPA: PKD domain-containing protein, partial [Vicinamibacterales bacterium]|nr:PKD domain-containing protein [Vicinamibacterales bacterium]
VANAGADATGVNGATITLDGSGSTDADGDPLTYSWTLLAVPPGSAAALANQTTVAPSFVIDISGEYVAQLIVNDGHVDSAADTVTITTLNTRPIANAGADRSAPSGQLVELDGSGSTDVDGDALTYQWSLTTVPPGSAAALSDAAAVRPTFTPDIVGLYVAQLIVSDAASVSDPDTATILIADEPVNQPPVAEAGTPNTVGIGETVGLDGTLSSDPNGDQLTYRWSLTPPPGSTAVLDDPTAAQPTFVADIFGNYVAQLIVNDGFVDSAPDTVTISTLNSAPVAHAGSDRSVAPGTTVILDGSASFDPDNVPITYSWSLTPPAGSAAVLSSTSVVDPSFVADVNGVYVAQLIVGDGVHQSDPDTVAITAQPGADLRLAFFGIPPNPPVGSTFNVGLDVRNDGPASADDVAILFQPPAGYTLTNVAVHFGGPYEQGSGTWSLGTLANGGLGRIILTLRVNATGPYDLAASITNSSVPDPDPADNTLTAAVTPDPNADLRLFFCTPPPAGTFAVGATTTWCLEIRNDGPAGTTGLNAQHVVPDGWTVTNSVVHFAGTYDQASGNWSVPVLGVGGLSRLFITARVNATGGTALQAAIIGSDQPDPDAADTIVTNPPINRPPVANAGADLAGSTHATVAFDGSLTSDPEGDPLTLQWTFTLRPVNSVATVANANTAAPSFIPDQGGTYTAQLTVTDPSGASSVDTVNITVAVLNNPPVIRSAPNTIGAIGQPYQYQVRADDPDAGDTLSFALPAAPSGMTIDPAAGAIAWVPSEDDAGPQQVTVRVQDSGGLFALQSFAVQVSSAGNRSPVATDDSFEVRVDESLGIATPGVLQNDADETPLSARLLTGPANGTLLFQADGSFVYTPHTQRPGELVMAENVNLANRLPGVTVNASGFFFHGQPCGRPECAVDENPATSWSTHFEPQPFLEVQFPLDVVLNRVEILGHRNPFLINLKITAGILQVFAADGRELYNSGNVELPLPARDATFALNNLTGARRVRFSPTAGDGNSVLSRGFAELKVIGSALVRRELVPEPNVARLLPATVQASSVTPPNQPEALIDESSANWYAASAQAGEFVQITLPQDATVTRIESANPSGRPDGFGTSLLIDCSGSFTLLDVGGNVLFDSGVVNTPTGGLNSSITFSLDTGVVAGVRRLRYTTTGCSGFPLGFSEIRLFGTADVGAPAFALGEKFQSLFGHEIHSTPIVINLTDDNVDGAIDASDVPDIVVPVESSSDQLRGEIKAISGADGTVLFTAGSPNLVSPWSELAAGDLDGDGLPEIVAVHGDRNHLIAFDHTGAVKWTSDAHSMPQFALGSGVGVGAVTLANLDGAGPPEVIIGASVFDSEGRLRGDGRTLGGTTGGTGLRSAIPAVGDIDLDGVPELVAGPTAYRLADTLTRVWQRPDRTDGFVGIANLDDDPTAEIVIVANGAVYALNHDGSDAEVWNPPSRAPVAIPGGGQGGAPLIVDVDGDGRPEIGVAGAVNYVLFNRDGSIRWQSVVRDRSSHSTGSIAFDLDGDGRVEIIYRDEFFLRIYRGSDGVLLAKTPVGSSTWAELPVVADVDNDGHADLIVSSDFLAQAAGATDTGIIVLQDAANKWTRTRRIWNQHAYHVTNVNEDGSIPLVATPHWLVPGLNSFRTNAFPAVANGDRADHFTYVASDGVLESNIATVHITVRTPNAGPQITSTAAASAAHGVRYTYAVIATDPDPSDLLTFSLPSAPPGMLIDAITGLIQWVPADTQAGSHDVIVKVEDLRGLYAVQGFSVTVADAIAVPDVRSQLREAAASTIGNAGLVVGAESTRHSPTVPAGAVLAQSPSGGTLVAPQSAVNLVVSLGPAPAGTVPDLIGMAQAAAAADIAAAGFAVGAVSGQNHATVPANVVLAQNPAAGSIADLASAIDLIVSLGPPPGEIDGDGDGFTGDQGDCNDGDPAIHPAAIDLPGDGIDQNCNGADSMAGDQTPPTAQLVAPADLSEVTMPTDVVGTVADANLLRYTVQLAEVDATTFTVIGSGTTPVTGGIVGRLDPTLLENGLYRVRLIAEDVNGQTAIDERVYRIDGAAKVGLFTLTFVDLRVPVTGIPITIERTYDSRVKTQRDFGVGWSLVVKAGRVQHNRPTGEGWLLTDNGGPFDLPCTVTNELRSHITEVRLSDRESYLFRPVLRDVAALGGGCTGTVQYELAGGTALGATLAILDGDDFLFTPGDNRLFYIDGSLNTGLLFNPRQLRLTTVDGRVVDLERGIGVTRLQDNNGNSLTIGDGGIVHSSGKSVAFTRDARGRLIRITDPRGHTLEYGYTGDDLTTFSDQERNVTTFTYDEDHNLVTITDPLGNRAILSEYDADGRLIAVTDARGGRTEFAHDVEGREEVVIDALGRTSRVVYDDRGHLTLQERAVTIDGATVMARTSFQHDAAGNETEVVDADGVRIQGAYDGLNLLEEVVDPDGLALRTLRTYDARGEVLTQTDATGASMAFAYDTRGNLTVLTDGAGSQARLSYDTGGRPTSSTDALGRVRRLALDTSGRVVREEQLDVNGVVVDRVDYSYDANGNRLTRTELRFVNGVPTPVTTTFAYDAHNRLIAITDALGGVVRIEYNAVGLESARIDPLGRRTEFSYDEVGALLRTDFPDATFESHQYDAVGNLTSTRDRGGRTSTFEHDELKRQVRAIRPDGSSVRTVYSAAGRVLATIDARGHRTDHEYDAAGRRVRTRQPAVVDATSGTERRPETIYEHDGAGRISSIVDPNGRRTSFEYDGMGRLLRREAADGTAREYVYDDAGQLIEQRDESGRRTLSTYDGAGRLTSVTDALSGVTSYAYDSAGLLQSQTDALGRTTRFLRDALGRVTTRRLPGGAVETFAYDAMGNTLAHTDFNGATVRFTYDVMDRLIRRRYPDGLEHSFTYAPAGQRSGATDARGTTNYTYDVNDRLTRIEHPGGEAIEYGYDLDGNIRRIDSGAGVIDYTRDAMNRITGVGAVLSGLPLGSVGFGYDIAGNL